MEGWMNRKKWIEPKIREVTDVPAAWGECMPGSTPFPGSPCDVGAVDAPPGGCYNGYADFLMCSTGDGVGPT
jgi:hypothetical protein